MGCIKIILDRYLTKRLQEVLDRIQDVKQSILQSNFLYKNRFSLRIC